MIEISIKFHLETEGHESEYKENTLCTKNKVFNDSLLPCNQGTVNACSTSAHASWEEMNG